jgi:hypothetical protein
MFENEFLSRLKSMGFAVSGKHVFLRENLNMTALVRLGGKYQLTSPISWVLCFRHTFLRATRDLRILTGVGDVFDYPFKFGPERLMTIPKTMWFYVPRNLHYDHEDFAPQEQSQAKVSQRLVKLADFLVSEFIPWTRKMTPERVEKEILKNGEQAWIEKVWLEDYEGFLSRKTHA